MSSFVTKRGEMNTMDDDLEVQNFSDSDEADGEEVIYPSTKPELVRQDTELFKRTLPIKVDSTDDDNMREVRHELYNKLVTFCVFSFRILFQVRWCLLSCESDDRHYMDCLSENWPSSHFQICHFNLMVYKIC